MPVVCPHCFSPAGEAASGEMVCPSCGSGFRVDAGATTAFEAGRRLGRFELIDQLGAGAFGTVYLARDPQLDREVALKLPRPGTVDQGPARERFLREARSAARLTHPSIVAVHEVGEADGTPYLVSELVRGITLADWLGRSRPSAAEAARIAGALADALHYAHQSGVVHRDVKPSNVLLGADHVPRLTDFGLARRDADDVTLTVEGQVLGTPAYASPEQARGEARDADARSDVYSLGVVLYQMLTGELPFRGTPRMLLHQVLNDEPRPPRRLSDRVPRDLETICLKSMAKEPARRYQTAGEMADDLRRFLAGEPIRARPPGRFERVWRWARRRPSQAALAAVTVLALLALGGLLVGLVYTGQLTRARDEADKQRHKAVDALERLEQASYQRNLALAEREWAANNVGRVRELLDDCPASLRGWEWRYLDRASRRTGRSFTGAPGGFYFGDVSPNGRLIVCVSPARIHVRDLESGRELQSLENTTGGTGPCAFSPDGTLLACSGGNVKRGAVVVYDVTGPPEAPRLTERYRRREIVTWWAPLAFSADGKTLAIAGREKDESVVLLLDPKTGNERRRLTAPNDLASFRFSPDGAWMVAGTGSDPYKPERPKATLLVWEAATGKEHKRLTIAQHWASASFVSDKLLAVSTNRGPAQTYSVPDLAPAGLVSGPDDAATLAPHRDGKRIAIAGIDRVVRLHDVATGEILSELRGHTSAVYELLWHPDGRRLIAAGGPNYHVWDTSETQGPVVLRGGRETIQQVTASPDGRLVASACRDRTVRLWEVDTGRQQRQFGPLPNAAWGVAFSPDGERLACGLGDWQKVDGQGEVWVWDVKTGERLLRFDGGPALVWTVAYSPDGKTLATGSGELYTRGEVCLRDAATGRPRHVFAVRNGVSRVAFSSDGSRLAALANYAGECRVWEVESGREVARPALGFNLNALAFHPEGRHVALGGSATDALLWDLESGKRVASFRGQTDDVRDLAYCTGGTRLISAGQDRLIKVWDASTAQELLTLKGHRDGVTSVAFSPKGDWIASGSDDGTVRVWLAGEPPR